MRKSRPLTQPVNVDSPSESPSKCQVRKKVKGEGGESPHVKMSRKMLEFGNFDRGDRVARIEPY